MLLVLDLRFGPEPNSRRQDPAALRILLSLNGELSRIRDPVAGEQRRLNTIQLNPSLKVFSVLDHPAIYQRCSTTFPAPLICSYVISPYASNCLSYANFANYDFSRYFSGGGGTGASPGVKSSLNKIFDKYRDDVANSPDMVGVEGTMKYLPDIGVDIEGLDALAAMEVVQAPAMGEMSREGFVDGWAALK